MFLIIADDFTGALDTGVQFAKAGVKARLLMELENGFSQWPEDLGAVIVNTASRHMPPAGAFDAVGDVVRRARAAGIEWIYKKTDSALRGNIGSELYAALDAGGSNALCFVPAFPKTGRTTAHGIQYVDGTPVAESAFGKDPFSPVLRSDVAGIIAMQADVPVCVLSGRRMPELTGEEPPTIYVFDAESDRDLREAAAAIRARGIRILAGCAGFAAYLPELGQLKKLPRAEAEFPPGVLYVSGSINPATRAQIRYARARGFPYVSLKPRHRDRPRVYESPECGDILEEMDALYVREGRLLLDVDDSAAPEPGAIREDRRAQVADNMGGIVRRFMERYAPGALAVIGGDTLLAVARHAGYMAMQPLDEIAPGVALSEAATRAGSQYIVSKSGGFGAEDVLLKIDAYVKERTRYAP